MFLTLILMLPKCLNALSCCNVIEQVLFVWGVFCLFVFYCDLLKDLLKDIAPFMFLLVAHIIVNYKTGEELFLSLKRPHTVPVNSALRQ